MDTAPHYAYLHVVGPAGEDFYAAFVQITGTDTSICGVAPEGFSTAPLAEVQVPLGTDEPTQGMVPAMLVEVSCFWFWLRSSRLS